MRSIPTTLKPPLPLFVGDVLRLKKPHPCGSREWTVVRLGADIGMTCSGCGRRILLPRREVERRLTAFLSRGEATDISPRSPNDEPGASTHAG